MLNIRACDDARIWNEAVSELGGSLFHAWEWGEVVRKVNWQPWRILAEDDAVPRAALQIFERKIPRLGVSLMYARRGIAGHDLDAATVSALTGWLRGFTKERGAILLRLETGFEDSDEARKHMLLAYRFRALPDQWSLWNAPRTTLVIDIQAPEEEILQRMRKSHRNCINAAQRRGLEIVATCDAEELKESYEVLRRSSQRQKFPIRPFEYFLNLRANLLNENRGKLFVAKLNGRVIAGIVCVGFGSTCHNLYAGFDWDARQMNPNEPLHWAAIRWAKQTGCKYYDMVGAGTLYPPKEGNAGYGLYNFKKGFGSELVYFGGYFDLVSRPMLYAALRLAETHRGWIPAAKALRLAYRRIFMRD